MSSVTDIIVDRLVDKIMEDGELPWFKTFKSACMNWYTKREYLGINKIMLDGGGYITKNQLESYNKKENRSFWFDKGTQYEIVVFYNNSSKSISEEQAKKEILLGNRNKVKKTYEGYVLTDVVLKYFRVYNIRFIREIVNPDVAKNKSLDNCIFKKETKEVNGRLTTKVTLDRFGVPVLLDGVNDKVVYLVVELMSYGKGTVLLDSAVFITIVEHVLLRFDTVRLVKKSVLDYITSREQYVSFNNGDYSLALKVEVDYGFGILNSIRGIQLALKEEVKELTGVVLGSVNVEIEKMVENS